MLKRMKGPVVLRKNEHGTLKSIHLRGKQNEVAVVAEHRVESKYCNQSPPTAQAIPKEMTVRITYEVADDGFIVIQRVYVHLQSKWSCYFDRSNGRVGEIRGLTGTLVNPQFIYLTERRLSGIIEDVGRIEDAKAVKKLAKRGPQIFPRKKSG